MTRTVPRPRRGGRASAALHLCAAALVLAPACAGGAGQAVVDIFPGFGNPKTLWVSGRVYEAPQDGWRALGALRKALLGGAKPEEIALRAGAVRATTGVGPDGYFFAAVPALPGAPWSGAVRLVAVTRDGEEFRGMAYVPAPGPGTGLISGVEDTIVTGDHGPAEADELTGRPVPGMAALYTRFAAWGTRSPRPVCYVSSSPDPYTARTTGFLSINRFPPGPLMLMRPDPPAAGTVLSPMRVYDHTLTAIQNALAAWPEKKFVLFGSAAGDDAEIYRCVALQHRGRVRGVYLRRGGARDRAREKEYPGFLFFDRAEEAARDLACKGILEER